MGRCGSGRRQQIREFICNPGAWAVMSYRFRRWILIARPPKPVRMILNPLCTLVQICTLILTNIELPATAEIGPGLYIPHTGYIVLGGRVRIGSNCTLTQGVTIGHAGGGGKSAELNPVIGNRVYIGPSAVIIGPVAIADDALIGAGAIVISSVPSGGVVVGNPARLVSSRGSFDLITYAGMEQDAERNLALIAIRGQPANPAVVAEVAR